MVALAKLSHLFERKFYLFSHQDEKNMRRAICHAADGLSIYVAYSVVMKNIEYMCSGICKLLTWQVTLAFRLQKPISNVLDTQASPILVVWLYFIHSLQ